MSPHGGRDVRQHLADERRDPADLEGREPRHDRVQRDGVAHDGVDLGQQPGHRRHRERGRALAVHDGLEACRRPVAASTWRTAAGWSYAAASSSVHGTGSRSMEARQLSSHTSQPVVEQRVDEGAGQRRPEQLGPHAGAVHDQDRAAGGCVPALDVHDSQRPPVEGGERHDLGAVVGAGGGSATGGHGHAGTSRGMTSGASMQLHRYRGPRQDPRVALAAAGRDVPPGRDPGHRQRVHDEAAVVADVHPQEATCGARRTGR